jgi:hypothetical protein
MLDLGFDQAPLCMFQDRVDLLSCNAGKPLEEFLDSRPTFQILK